MRKCKVIGAKYLCRKRNPYKKYTTKGGIERPARRQMLPQEGGFFTMGVIEGIGTDATLGLEVGDCVLLNNYRGTPPTSKQLHDDDQENTWVLTVAEEHIWCKVHFNDEDGTARVEALGDSVLVSCKNPTKREHNTLVLPTHATVREAADEDNNMICTIIDKSEGCTLPVEKGTKIITDRDVFNETLSGAFVYGIEWYVDYLMVQDRKEEAADVDGTDYTMLDNWVIMLKNIRDWQMIYAVLEEKE